ncbi:hypothetical protein E1B28_008533 [Marasmius oreades]|uniref:Uncharacterized protein n=1 Tax=Marasmius oreades TaxID=181124 RepID=A0A9P7UUD7_9AGAR|nr:uncharacterized protein E1B28_008533 [Marasmius oreades]KAG7092164.1 hypothetical protein E1B28_008533 [Marasmius oreades]
MATVMEPFDAQMMDYHNDGDIQMHASHEIWLQEEAPMEDDGHQLHGETHSSSTEFEDVEIDMEENQTETAQNPEYEMVDEDGGLDYPVGDVEEDDIIVHDVSHPTAGIMSDFYASADPTTSSFPSQEQVLRQQETHLTSNDSINAGGNSIELGDNYDNSPTIQPETLTHALPPSESFEAPTVEEAGGSLSANKSAAVSTTDLSEVQVQAELAGNIIQPEQSAEGDNDLSSTSRFEPPAVESFQVHAESAPDHDDEFSGAGSHTHEAPLSEEATVDDYPQEEPEDPEGTGATLTQHDHNPETESLQVDDAVNHNEPIAQMTNKGSLELSEGAALDPPPGVLLFFAHVDHPEVCLFSQPNHPESSSAAGHSYKLILENNPSLYYEPLSALFDALRQNESMDGLFDLSLSELMIDAFDLQLVISEDNIFSRDTSLYDLHQLHEGSSLPGPLRLRLQTASPRFIVRYRQLQDQIYRLDLAADDHEEPTEQVEGHGAVEEQTATTHPETEGIEETYTEELTRVENSGEELEHGYDANFEQQEQDDENENENETSHEASSDTVAAEEPLEDDAETEAREKEDDSAAQGHEEIDERNSDTVATNSLEVGTTTAVSSILSANEEEAYDETTHNGQDYADNAEAENTSQLNAEHPEPLPEGLDLDGETHLTHAINGHAAEVEEINSDEIHAERGNDEESYAGNTDDWDDTFEDDGGLDTTFEEGAEEELVVGESTSTLASKSSKRSIDEVEAEGIDDVSLPLDSPGSKRPRVD